MHRFVNLAGLLGFACLTLFANQGRAEKADAMEFMIGMTGRIPSALEEFQGPNTTLNRAGMNLPVERFLVGYGVYFDDISSTLSLHTGYGLAFGDLPTGSELGGEVANSYRFSEVPILVGWRSALTPYWIQPTGGVSLGGAFQSFSVDLEQGRDPSASWSFRWGLELHGGIAWEFTQKWSLRTVAGYRIQQQQRTDRGVGISTSGPFAYVELVATFDTEDASSWATPTSSRQPSANITTQSPLASEPEQVVAQSPLERAFELIREADIHRDLGELEEAEQKYREGIRQLPHDPRTRQNVEIPVRLDLARVLLQLQDYDAAEQVVRINLEINEKHRQSRKLLRRILRVNPKAKKNGKSRSGRRGPLKSR